MHLVDVHCYERVMYFQVKKNPPFFFFFLVRDDYETVILLTSLFCVNDKFLTQKAKTKKKIPPLRMICIYTFEIHLAFG